MLSLGTLSLRACVIASWSAGFADGSSPDRAASAMSLAWRVNTFALARAFTSFWWATVGPRHI